MTPEDEWESRLRDTLHGPDAGGPVDVEGFLGDVHRGARGRRRRQYIGVAAGVAVLAGGGIAVGTLVDGSPDPSRDIADRASTAAEDTSSTGPATTGAPSTTGKTDPTVTEASTRVESLTATGNDHQWVLVRSDGCEHDACGTVYARDPADGTWTAVGAQLQWPVDNDSGDLRQVSELRFVGDADEGYDAWAFGPGILSAHGIAATGEPTEWTPWTGDPNGQVLNLEGRADTVYALIVDGESHIDLMTSPADRDEWTVVPDLEPSSYTGDLVVSQGLVAFQSTTNGSTLDTVVSSPADPETGSLTGEWTTTTPCGPHGAVSLTSAANSLWVLCADGHAATTVVGDAAPVWTDLDGDFTKRALISARSATSAVVADTNRLAALNVNGTITELSTQDFSDADMIGFTNDTLGFAVLNGELWRTDDAGESWTVDPVVPPAD